jgi:hypothetical protein
MRAALTLTAKAEKTQLKRMLQATLYDEHFANILIKHILIKHYPTKPNKY